MSKDTALALELAVGAALDDAPLAQDDDLVDVAEGAEAVGDHQHRPPCEQRVERPHHLALSLDVEVGGGLVEDEDGSVMEDRSGDRQALALAAGEVLALLAHVGVVPLGQAGDGVVDVRLAGGLGDLVIAGLGPAQGDVLANAALEEHRVLENQAGAGAQLLERNVADVDTVHGDRAVPDVVEARHQLDQGCLAASAQTDQGDAAPAWDVEVDPGEHRLAGVVAEDDVTEGDRSGDPLGGRALQPWLAVLHRHPEHFGDAVGAGRGIRGQAGKLGEVAHRLVEQLAVEEEDGQGADGEAAPGDGQAEDAEAVAAARGDPGADAHEQGVAEGHHGGHQRGELRLHTADPKPEASLPLDCRAEVAGGPILEAEGLELDDRPDILGGDLGHLTAGLGGALARLLDRLRVEEDDGEERRDDAHRQHGELPVEQEHDHENAAQGEDAGKEVDQAVGDQLLDVGDVAGETLDQIAGPLAAMPFQGQPLQVAEQPVAQPGTQPGADPGGHDELGPGDEGAERADDQQQHHREGNDTELGVCLGCGQTVGIADPVEAVEQPAHDRDVGVHMVEELVEHELEGEGGEQVGTNRDEGQGDGHGHHRSVPAQVGPQETEHQLTSGPAAEPPRVNIGRSRRGAPRRRSVTSTIVSATQTTASGTCPKLGKSLTSTATQPSGVLSRSTP